MEIIIAMAIAFILGAFVRKPFILPKKQKAEPEKIEEEKPENEKQATEEQYIKELNALISYTGEANEN